MTRAENSMTITIRFAAILLPLLVVLTGIVGYRFTRRTLLPVTKITETVQKIRRDEDLSQRVGLGNGKDEIYRLSRTFDEMLEELEEAFKREQQFTSDVSHELRTPVTVILAQCESVLQDPETGPKQKAQVEIIEKKARAMARMISQLLLLSRADQGRQQGAERAAEFKRADPDGGRGAGDPGRREGDPYLYRDPAGYLCPGRREPVYPDAG